MRGNKFGKAWDLVFHNELNDFRERFPISFSFAYPTFLLYSVDLGHEAESFVGGGFCGHQAGCIGADGRREGSKAWSTSLGLHPSLAPALNPWRSLAGHVVEVATRAANGR